MTILPTNDFRDVLRALRDEALSPGAIVVLSTVRMNGNQRWASRIVELNGVRVQCTARDARHLKGEQRRIVEWWAQVRYQHRMHRVGYNNLCNILKRS